MSFVFWLKLKILHFLLPWHKSDIGMHPKRVFRVWPFFSNRGCWKNEKKVPEPSLDVWGWDTKNSSCAIMKRFFPCNEAVFQNPQMKLFISRTKTQIWQFKKQAFLSNFQIVSHVREKSSNSKHPLGVHPNVRLMSREQKMENFQFQPENKTHFTPVFGERFFKF